MDIIVGNGYGDLSSNTGQSRLHYISGKYSCKGFESSYSFQQ